MSAVGAVTFSTLGTSDQTDMLGSPKYAFLLATVFSAVLLAGLIYNWVRQPTRGVLSNLAAREYGVSEPLRT